jgi:hypothetical protein
VPSISRLGSVNKLVYSLLCNSPTPQAAHPQPSSSDLPVLENRSHLFLLSHLPHSPSEAPTTADQQQLQEDDDEEAQEGRRCLLLLRTSATTAPQKYLKR